MPLSPFRNQREDSNQQIAHSGQAVKSWPRHGPKSCPEHVLSTRRGSFEEAPINPRKARQAKNNTATSQVSVQKRNNTPMRTPNRHCDVRNKAPPCLARRDPKRVATGVACPVEQLSRRRFEVVRFRNGRGCLLWLCDQHSVHLVSSLLPQS